MSETYRDTIKRCAIYIRVSTAEQRIDGWSLQAQEAGLRAVAERNGWKVVGVYADEGKSARKRLRGRKAIFDLLEDVKAGLVDVILFKELDRWMRNMSDFYKVQDILDEYGVEWHSEQQAHLEMRTKEGRLQVNVLLSFGQNETDTTADRIKYTNKFLRQQKRWTAGPKTLPRCYTVDEDQHVIIDQERAPYVRALIDRFCRYGSARKALLETNAEFHEDPLNYNNAIRLLRNPMLYGEYREIPDFVAEPLMTKAEWEQMQSLMRRNARNTQSRTYIFAGQLRCSECGTNLTGTYANNGYKTYHYYRCKKALVDGTCSNRYKYPEVKLQKDLMQFVREATAEQIVRVKEVKQARKKKPARKGNRASIEKQLDKLEDLYISSERMTKEKYEEKRQAILAKLVEDEPEEKLPELADLEKIQELFDSGVENLYNDFTPEERRQFWRGILNSATIEGDHIAAVDFIE